MTVCPVTSGHDVTPVGWLVSVALIELVMMTPVFSQSQYTSLRLHFSEKSRFMVPVAVTPGTIPLPVMTGVPLGVADL